MIRNYKRKTQLIQVIQVDRDNPTEFRDFVNDKHAWDDDSQIGCIPVRPYGWLEDVEHSDFIVKFGEGDFDILLESEINEKYEVV
jgi:hypothetical protein